MKYIAQAIPITAYSAVTDCGLGNASLFEAISTQRNCLKPLELFTIDSSACVGEVRESLPAIANDLMRFNTRNAQIALATLDSDNKLVRKAVQRAIAKYGADRIGVVIGTSTSGMYETELAYADYLASGEMPHNFDFLNQHAWGATADYLKNELGLFGPSYAISTACSSSSKAIASAQRLITTGVCDAVLAGGVDTICQLILYGFSSLDLISEKPCTPLDQDRQGISLGEGGALLLLEKPAADFAACPQLLGCGESSDAYHMTAPHPDGEGAQAAMQMALAQAGLNKGDIDYLNLHATGTIMNDVSEMKAVHAVLGTDIACSGTKGITGHTLGATGAIESVISLLALEHGLLPGTAGLKQLDERFKCQVLYKPEQAKANKVMNNNFGFGGNNASLIFGRGQYD
ncbi:MAG: beta-ketoacyl-ACP synthase [Mariprofundales bacterium]